ncbi:MAG: hypothetical protein AVDCRST_MAG44-1339 [uncultured Sphingomonas sp.]|uniref:Uncharacterized protein n=1 Tax=uncultured Sphingomonas sp. TaxID=158754 RepID=A0A6J4T138_9SPHN|nr:MAG: hypothetical protein AVDCRST_MAG44-1339 [uncultured Sphingomonas sp.]
MTMFRVAAAASIACASALGSVSAHAQQEPVSRGPMLVEIATPTKPMLARAGGKDFLAYELHLTNSCPIGR